MIKADGGGEEEEGWFRNDESRAYGRQLFRRATILQVFVERIFIFHIFSSLLSFANFYVILYARLIWTVFEKRFL